MRSDGVVDADAATDAVPPTRRRRWWFIAAGVLAAVVLVASLATAMPLASAWSDRSTFEFTPTSADDASVVAIVGTDRRPGDGATADEKAGFGDRATVTGERADVVLLVRTGGGQPTAVLNLPRDLLVDTQGEVRRLRLSTTWIAGPQSFADTLCTGLGLGIDSMVVADPVAFIRVVDALGGVEVTTDAVLRDRKSALAQTAVGTQTLAGPQALAWVRARHLEELRAGKWVPYGGATGAQASLERSARSDAVLRDITGSLARRPWQLRTTADAALDGLRVSEGLSARQTLTTLRAVGTTTAVTPDVRVIEGPVPTALLTDGGRRAIADFIGGGTCTPSTS